MRHATCTNCNEPMVRADPMSRRGRPTQWYTMGSESGIPTSFCSKGTVGHIPMTTSRSSADKPPAIGNDVLVRATVCGFQQEGVTQIKIEAPAGGFVGVDVASGAIEQVVAAKRIANGYTIGQARAVINRSWNRLQAINDVVEVGGDDALWAETVEKAHLTQTIQELQQQLLDAGAWPCALPGDR